MHAVEDKKMTVPCCREERGVQPHCVPSLVCAPTHEQVSATHIRTALHCDYLKAYSFRKCSHCPRLACASDTDKAEVSVCAV